MDSAAGAPLEEIRYQAQKEVETNYLIMTEGKMRFFTKEKRPLRPLVKERGTERCKRGRRARN